jgi:hypothetical protein
VLLFFGQALHFGQALRSAPAAVIRSAPCRNAGRMSRLFGSAPKLAELKGMRGLPTQQYLEHDALPGAAMDLAHPSVRQV